MEPLQQLKAAIFRLQPLAEEEWEAFAANLVKKHYRKGDFLISEGDTENHIYFLISGATRHYFMREDKEFTVNFQFAGDFVTAYYSLITREPSAVSITLMEDSVVWTISLKVLHAFYAQFKTGKGSAG